MNKLKPIGGGRPPVVAIVGHIDHGKSTLLDYIRRANVAEAEAGGITQHLSAYEALHKNSDGTERTITFLDTPGHEAFRSMRMRGLEVADIAILVVSAEEGVKPQTLEAHKLITEVKIPYIVALTKIDKPGANLERARASLLEHGLYLEGLGGEVPHVALSGKTGQGVPELLDLILLAADLEGLATNPDAPGEGVVIEAHVDNRRGTSATLIVRNGSIRSGQFVVAGGAVAPTRIMENFLGQSIREALPGKPVCIVGFSALPAAGTPFKTVESKKEAEEEARKVHVQGDALKILGSKASPSTPEESESEEVEKTILPLVIKTDVAGAGEAVLHELEKLPRSERYEVRVVSRGVGPITEGDIKLIVGSRTPGIVVGFNVELPREARELAERRGIATETFTVIYKLAEWLAERVEERRPRERVEERTGSARVVKLFSTAKGSVVVGGRVEEGELRLGEEIKIMRRGLLIGGGTITSLQSQKTPVKKVAAGSEFGVQIKTGSEPAPGDHLEAYEIVYK